MIAPSPLVGNFDIPDREIDIAAALRWSWGQFRAHPWSMIVPGLISTVMAFVLTLIGQWVSVNRPRIYFSDLRHHVIFSRVFEDPKFDAKTIVIGLILYFVSMNVTLYFQNCTVSGAIRAARGESIGPKAFLVPMHFRNTVRTVTIACVGLILGAIAFIIPALIVLYFWQFSILIAIGTETGPIDSVKASQRITRTRVVASLLTLLVCGGLIVVGFLVYFVGLIVAGPLAALVQAHCFRQIMGLPIEQPVRDPA
ncbi:proline and glycine rich protein [Gordonia neofelifaecis]|uniref:Proline and glycine rich transmembrane protein n=1 Tax=Gordonia neofelifaecis NRRL B-59395 TaxID=644548 RepID=F1YIH8_9ACTN|nr:proline and glycine rich protein [Gordonia neofelifaecis]EGD55732.1 proline and glycine rich transmembrane protein [Gordonia neofelifaecis NRRL B-59395]